MPSTDVLADAPDWVTAPDAPEETGATRIALPAPESIPAAMRALPRWVCWHYAERDGKQTKLPVQTNGWPARSNDRTTWATFDVAYSAAQRTDAGLGFMLGSGIVGVDLDHVVDLETGAIETGAQTIIDELRSYAERSPSRTGVHVLCHGTLPAAGRRKGCVEMYSDGRFFTVTGDRLNDLGLEDRTTELAAVHAQVFGAVAPRTAVPLPKPVAIPPEPVVLPSPELDPGLRAILDAAMKIPKFGRLSRCDDHEYNGDRSSADLAYCNLLATMGMTREQIDAAFRSSPRMRPKWDTVHFAGGFTYGEATITKALARTTAPAPQAAAALPTRFAAVVPAVRIKQFGVETPTYMIVLEDGKTLSVPSVEALLSRHKLGCAVAAQLQRVLPKFSDDAWTDVCNVLMQLVEVVETTTDQEIIVEILTSFLQSCSAREVESLSRLAPDDVDFLRDGNPYGSGVIRERGTDKVMLKLSRFSRFTNVERDCKYSQQALGAALAKIGFRKTSNVASTGGAAARVMSGKVWIGRVAEPQRRSE